MADRMLIAMKRKRFAPPSHFNGTRGSFERTPADRDQNSITDLRRVRTGFFGIFSSSVLQ